MKRKLTAKERNLCFECKYQRGGNVSWLGAKLGSRIKAYTLLANAYLEHRD